MGSLVAYVNVLADVWSAVAGTIIPPGAEPSRNAMMIGMLCTCIVCVYCVRVLCIYCVCVSCVRVLCVYIAPVLIDTMSMHCCCMCVMTIHMVSHIIPHTLYNTTTYTHTKNEKSTLLTSPSPPLSFPTTSVITVFGALPVALFVRGPQLLAIASQAAVGFAFAFGLSVAGLAFTSSSVSWGT